MSTNALDASDRLSLEMRLEITLSFQRWKLCLFVQKQRFAHLSDIGQTINCRL